MHELNTKCYEGVPIENFKKVVEKFEGTNARTSTKEEENNEKGLADFSNNSFIAKMRKIELTSVQFARDE